jgi:hypothetical protein
MIMRHIFSILSFIASFEILAADPLPTPPSVSAPYSTEQLLRSDGSNYTGIAGAFNVTLENNNSKPIRCIDATFPVTMDYAGNGCTNKFISTTINLGNDKKILDIQPGQPFRNKIAGNAERLAYEKDNPSDLGLEFCDRNALSKDFQCGFNCDGHYFNDTWTTDITGGTLKERCAATGIPEVIALSCDLNKYVPSKDGKSCVAKSCGDTAHGLFLTSKVAYGTATYECKYGVPEYVKTECKDEFYEQIGIDCRPKTTKFVYMRESLPHTCTKGPAANAPIICLENQVEAFGPYIKLPHPGRLKVIYYITATMLLGKPFFPASPPPGDQTVYRFDVADNAGQTVLAERFLKVQDLTLSGPAPGDNPSVVKQRLNYEGGPASGPASSRPVVIEFDLLSPANGVEFRVVNGNTPTSLVRKWYMTEVYYTPAP